ncbi:hypothetical protein RHMOL_Rhmol12G0170700 [Rhododendron molle]|uniref:Uncharacterized protein n=1 Tax=Rhododendron molle TaxID=49168 RepID=A0ACC0LKH1_RHOML|nr:hypothetical protein RHMOL_Rhmol12G0170700 [Rhododendron molle]
MIESAFRQAKTLLACTSSYPTSSTNLSVALCGKETRCLNVESSGLGEASKNFDSRKYHPNHSAFLHIVHHYNCLNDEIRQLGIIDTVESARDPLRVLNSNGLWWLVSKHLLRRTEIKVVASSFASLNVLSPHLSTQFKHNLSLRKRSAIVMSTYCCRFLAGFPTFCMEVLEMTNSTMWIGYSNEQLVNQFFKLYQIVKSIPNMMENPVINRLEVDPRPILPYRLCQAAGWSDFIVQANGNCNGVRCGGKMVRMIFSDVVAVKKFLDASPRPELPTLRHLVSLPQSAAETFAEEVGDDEVPARKGSREFWLASKWILGRFYRLNYAELPQGLISLFKKTTIVMVHDADKGGMFGMRFSDAETVNKLLDASPRIELPTLRHLVCLPQSVAERFVEEVGDDEDQARKGSREFSLGVEAPLEEDEGGGSGGGVRRGRSHSFRTT